MRAKKKILIADDEEDVLAVVEKKLRESGYYVIAVTNGGDAVEMAKLNKPDLAILDIAMPVLDGYAVAQELRKDDTLKHIPVIFITGKDLEFEGIEKRMFDLGAFDFLRKPCAYEDILIKVKEAIG